MLAITDHTTEYAQQVIDGKIVAGPHVRASCARHLKDLERAKTEAFPYWFDPNAAARVFDYFRVVLKHNDGKFADQGFELHPSQMFIVGSIFGWKRMDGTRRFRRAYLEIGKGNGKTPVAAGLGLYAMAADGEPGAQIYAAGSKKLQADILFQDAVKMAKKAPSLAKRIAFSGVNPVYNMAIPHKPQDGSFFRPVSRETGRHGSGPRPHWILCDELHEHTDRQVLEILERGFKARTQPFLLMTTNSGTDRNSICYEEHHHAVEVAHGRKEDETTFSYVCALDEGDDPFEDPSCWIKANPLLGVIITEEYLKGVVAQAKAMPGKANNILRLHFCTWTDADTAWIGRDTWEACEDETLRLDQFEGRTCYAGLDLSSTQDLTGTALVFEDGFTADNKPKFVAFAHGYTPKDTLEERARSDMAPYDVWAKQGHLTATPGKLVRFDYVIQDLMAHKQKFDLQVVAYDRYLIKHFEQVMGELNADLPLHEHGQGLSQRRGCPPDCNKAHKHDPAPLWMPGSINDLETLILEKRIRFAVNPALRSAVSSARFWSSPAGLRRFEKNKPGGRIDLLISLTMAVGAATIQRPREREYSVLFIGNGTRS
jgi:phage terminase large subunit-like protein